ncbi:MAG: hypothetical protein M3Q51_01905 [Pseudomonadota bacterium]|nr:hypothetical protein [Pseudomonadota bacterium]
MHKVIFVAAIAALAACDNQAAPTANDADATTTNDVAATPVPAASPINETTWEFTEGGKPMQESIDANGNYIVTSGSTHIDHGTVVMRDGKACFTSAMTNEGEECWTDPKLGIGASGETVSDKGEKLALKRVTYVPKTM